MNIYIGNLSYDTTEDQLRDAFAAFGNVSSVKIIMDRDTGQPKGFGFVEMPSTSEASNAISSLNGREMNGRTVSVNEARPREEGGSRGGGGGYRGGGGGGGNRGGGNRGGGGGYRRSF